LNCKNSVRLVSEEMNHCCGCFYSAALQTIRRASGVCCCFESANLF